MKEDRNWAGKQDSHLKTTLHSNYCEDSDYNMKMWSHKTYHSEESGEYEFYINLYIEGERLLILVSEEGYSDAQHVFLHSKPQALIEILANIYNNCEKCFKEYFKTYMLEASLRELGTTEWESTHFKDIRFVYKEEAEKLLNDKQ